MLWWLNIGFDLGNIAFAQLAQEGGRSDRVLEMVHQEPDDAGSGLELGDVARRGSATGAPRDDPTTLAGSRPKLV